VADHGLDQELLAFIEIPKGSRNKYEFDEGIGQVILDRFLSSSTVYPTDYGYLIDHRGRDGDPLDVLVCVSEPTFPGCVIPVKPVALFDMRDEKGQDDKIVCVPLNDPNWNHLDDLDDLTEMFQLEVAHFFSVYKQIDRKPVEIGGWYPRSKALEIIEDARRRHREETAQG
jgi:inorganic pyrophosphatase